MDRSPLAPAAFPELPPIAGAVLTVARAGYRDWGRCDLTLARFDEGTTVAGVTTRSRCPSPEVEWCREALPRGKARALVVNAGNSNAFTGGRGRTAVDAQVARVTSRLGCEPFEVFTASTGVIGVPLPIDKAEAGVEAAFAAAAASWEEAAAPIMTTDTFPKAAVRRAVLGGREVSLVGIVKGSGMIMPDMATMLGFIFTDAAVAPGFLQEMLSTANTRSFSCITVDSDTSTSDTVLAFATGKAGNPPLASWDDAGAGAFQGALTALCAELAQLVVRDGEGASKFIAIEVAGAVSDDSARRVAMSSANPPLVKTAIAREDANWGRVVMAIGKAGEPAERDRVAIRFGDTQVARDGLAVEDYDEAPVARHLQGREIDIGVDLGLGDGRATIWTCDLTHGYISSTADYRSCRAKAGASLRRPAAARLSVRRPCALQAALARDGVKLASRELSRVGRVTRLSSSQGVPVWPRRKLPTPRSRAMSSPPAVPSWWISGLNGAAPVG
jgi:glutamate N-acetyltransferase/amino-acid N-acetyltransferase